MPIEQESGCPEDLLILDQAGSTATQNSPVTDPQTGYCLVTVANDWNKSSVVDSYPGLQTKPSMGVKQNNLRARPFEQSDVDGSKRDRRSIKIIKSGNIRGIISSDFLRAFPGRTSLGSRDLLTCRGRFVSDLAESVGDVAEWSKAPDC